MMAARQANPLPTPARVSGPTGPDHGPLPRGRLSVSLRAAAAKQAVRLVALGIGLSVALADIAPALAQSTGGIVVAQNDNRPSIFRFLFQRPRGERVIEVPPRAAPKRRSTSRKKATRQERNRPARQSGASRKQAAAPAAPPPPPAVEKAADAKTVLVIGDFMARSVARGLDEAYSDNPKVIVEEATNGSSGLVRDDFYDWPEVLPGLIEEKKPDALVMMIGANDRQALSTPAGSRSPGTPEWRAAYAERVGEVATILAGAGVPAFWVGLVPVRSGAMSKDYSGFNSIYRERIEPQNIRYVDVWDGFADAEGKFAGSGPDISGQTAQLRDSDGLNFTRAGQRKLGFFVQQALDQILPAAPGEAVALVLPDTSGAIADDQPAIGPMIPIGALTTPAAAALSAAAPRAGEQAGDADKLVISRLVGEKASVPSGRVDNYAWPRRPASGGEDASGASEPGTPEGAVAPGAAAAAAAGR